MATDASQAADSMSKAEPLCAGGTTRPHHVARDIDGREISDEKEKVDLKFILAHSPNVEDDDDDTTTTASCASGSSGARSTAGDKDRLASVLLTSSMIESQFQPVEDDDVEYGEFEEDIEEETELDTTEPFGRRQRRSSLKHILRSPSTEVPPHDFSGTSPGGGSSSGRSSPGSASGGERKAVRFVEGPGLADMRELLSSDEPPEVPASALKDLRIRRRKRSQSTLTWSLNFEQPGSEPTFIRRVLKDKVSCNQLCR